MSTKNPSIAPRRQNLAPSPIESTGSPPVMMAPRTQVKTEVKGGGAAKTTTPQIITSKEWVLPPRPKPGRKPSIDTPASKRKAQNRAAQRAFRERRATRVQELEEQLLEVEKERDVKEMGLVNTINKLKVENQFLLKSIEQMRGEINAMKDIQTPSYTSQFNIPQFKLNYNNAGSPLNPVAGSPASSSYSIQQVSPAPSADSPTFVGSFRPNANNVNLTPDSSNTSPDKLNSKNSFDCGVCVKNECLCEKVGLKERTTKGTSDPSKTLEETINSFKPMPAVSLHKKRKFSETEVDFTKKFSLKKSMPDLKKLKQEPVMNEIQIINDKKKDSIVEFDESSPIENCGFCTDDTPCVCREAAREAARLNESLDNDLPMDEESKTSLPPIQLNSNSFAKAALPVMHPGPSVEIREITNLTPGAVPTVSTPTTRANGSIVSENIDNDSQQNSDYSKKSGCTGNPGTCEQCQMDPMSTLFCTTVASKAKTKDGTDSPSDASSIRSELNPDSRPDSRSSISSAPSGTLTQSGTFIPCADAYKTLSRHKKFNTVDFGTLVGKLTTRGMQVEVQSVANVLRELDRRFYN